MKSSSPIYNLLHQEIKTCAEYLLDISQKNSVSESEIARIIKRFNELHHFASKVRSEERYHPLRALKRYLENTMLPYKDEEDQPLTMRLSEAVSLLESSAQSNHPFKSVSVHSLMTHFLVHFHKSAKAGQPLFRKLVEIKKI